MQGRKIQYPEAKKCRTFINVRNGITSDELFDGGKYWPTSIKSDIARFGDRAPFPAGLVNEERVVEQVARLEVDEERGIPVGLEGGGDRHGRFETVGAAIFFYEQRPAHGVARIVWQCSEPSLGCSRRAN